jgi:3-oxoadipate enol-lactonase/4-carboxymuconolactone decarboxylase
MTAMSTMTDAAPVTLESRGAGPAVLFLHGTPTPWDVLRPVAEACRDRRTLLAALPGYGPSAPWTTAPSVDTIAEAIERAVLDAGGGDLSVVGFSGGAYHALHLAIRGKLRMGRVVALGGFAGLTTAEGEAFLGFAAMLRSGQPVTGIATQRFLSPAFAAARPAACQRVEEWMRAAPPESLAFELEALARAPSLLPALAQFPGRIVARTGELDVATPPDKARDIVSAARNAQLQIVPGCGHALLEEDAEATIRAVLAAIDARR